MTIDAQVKVLESVVSRLDTNIEKLTELSNSISRLLAVHDERIDSLERGYNRTDSDIKEIHSRITTISREICDKIDQVEGMIEQKLLTASEASAKGHSEIKEEIETKINKVVTRVETLESWRWWVIGAATATGWIISRAFKMLSL